MLLKDLFKKYNIECPDWLRLYEKERSSYDGELPDDWLGSQYSFEKGTHKWTLENSATYSAMSFDGEEYTEYVIHDGLEYPIHSVTEHHCIDY